MQPVRLVVALFMPLLQAERAAALVGIDGKDGVVARDGAKDDAGGVGSAAAAAGPLLSTGPLVGGGGGSGGGGDAGGLGLSRAATTSRCGGLVATASGALVAVTASDVLRAVAALASSREWLAALVACAARTEEAEEIAELASIKVCTAVPLRMRGMRNMRTECCCDASLRRRTFLLCACVRAYAGGPSGCGQEEGQQQTRRRGQGRDRRRAPRGAARRDLAVVRAARTGYAATASCSIPRPSDQTALNPQSSDEAALNLRPSDQSCVESPMI